MNNNINKIIVICNSDIILTGLGEILTVCNSDEIILLHHSTELIDYPYLSGFVLLIIPFTIYNNNEGFLRRMFSGAKEIKYLYMSHEGKDVNAGESINIYDDKASVINKVNGFLSGFGAKNEDTRVNELTKREIDVLQLVSKGLANKEVADKLSISIHTVISHRKNISEKTGIKSASGLTMYAVLKKIIDIDEISTSDLI